MPAIILFDMGDVLTFLPAAIGRLDPERIAATIPRIRPELREMPLRRDEGLDAALGCALFLKDETAGPLGCFKGRGADAYVVEQVESARALGVSLPTLVCASAGNFGLALADAGRVHGLSVIVFAAENASARKIERIRAAGGDVQLHGADFDAAKARARAHAAEIGARFVEDSADLAITEGTATIGIELEAGGPFDDIVVPVGNGALAAGIGAWFKARRHGTRIVGVCSEGAPIMRERWLGRASAGETGSCATIADGIGVRVPVPEAVDDLAHVLDEFVAVSDDATLATMRLLRSHTGLEIEPAAAVGIAAIAASSERYAGRRVATVLTGANLTTDQRRRWYPD